MIVYLQKVERAEKIPKSCQEWLREQQSERLEKLLSPHSYLLTDLWGCSSAGRAPALQAGGQEFDPPHLHQRASEDEETTTVARN